jgi:hypothetical protein
VAGVALLLLGSGLIAWQQWTRVEPRPRSAATSQGIPPVGAAAAAHRPQAQPAVETLVVPSSEAPAKDAG